MKILLDENIPVILKQSFKGFEISTVTERNWNGITNGDLLKLMSENSFDVLITLDMGLIYQQNLDNFHISIILLKVQDARINKLKLLVGKVLKILNSKSLDKFNLITDEITNT